MTKSELILKLAERNPHLYHRDVERIVLAIEREVATSFPIVARVYVRPRDSSTA